MKKLLENWRGYMAEEEKNNFEDYISNGAVKLYHYTNNTNSDELVLSPLKAYERRGYYSRRDYEVSNIPRLFFYLDVKDRERMFGNATLYTTTVNAGKIYNLATDPEDIFGMFKDKYGVDLNEVMKYISGWRQEDGEWKKFKTTYSGIYYKTGGMKIVNWFDEIKVTKEEKVKVTV